MESPRHAARLPRGRRRRRPSGPSRVRALLQRAAAGDTSSGDVGHEVDRLVRRRVPGRGGHAGAGRRRHGLRARACGQRLRRRHAAAPPGHDGRHPLRRRPGGPVLRGRQAVPPRGRAAQPRPGRARLRLRLRHADRERRASTAARSTTSRSTPWCSAGSWSGPRASPCRASSRSGSGAGSAPSTTRTSPSTGPDRPSSRAASAAACATWPASDSCSARTGAPAAGRWSPPRGSRTCGVTATRPRSPPPRRTGWRPVRGTGARTAAVSG